ncbi:MAG: 5'-nucleotidase, lipoprotein e(P4) family [Chlorobiales bacterium]
MNRVTLTLLLALGIGVFLWVFYLAREKSEPIQPRTMSRVAVPEKKISSAEQAVMATLWQQQSGEAKALYYQAYQLASIRLSEALKQKTKKPKAIIVDIDETVLDNSLYQAKLIERDTTHPAYWSEWCQLAKAQPTPGALEFLIEAQLKGVAVFYISNRSQTLLDATLKNLQLWKFPFADSAHVLLRADYPSKESRREKVAQTHDVILLCGDNLADFSKTFEGKSTEERNREVERLKEQFSKRFIILPNPMYGDWEQVIDESESREPKTRALKRKEALTSF